MEKIELQKLVGKRIVQLRTEKGWSQSDLARACEKDRQSIERIENGKVSPSLYSLYEIALALGVRLEELVYL
ncbi:helix-turn-helix transcriptional regulator [Dyadobacter aurulentus]|uniref:helix-turn-helix transcriptional regulator n=1 Tax=Dyadobacter sp. UC 10 TaxID=2605428 RepID=UPI0011F406A1|nr:helix-turn-helix transcriptional regulator [Dyadobacter sp. UC 10]KAA0989705.1 helix-turn-helix transcriptional regulator [Dyadobacter sp. UC 10]